MSKLSILICLLIVSIAAPVGSASGQNILKGINRGDGYSNGPVFYNVNSQKEVLFIVRDGNFFQENSSDRFFSVESDGPFQIRLRLISDWRLNDGEHDMITMNRGSDKLLELGVKLVAMNSGRLENFGGDFSLHLLPVQYFHHIGEELLLAEWSGGAFRGDFNLTSVLQLINRTEIPLITGRHNLLLEFSLVPK